MAILAIMAVLAISMSYCALPNSSIH